MALALRPSDVLNLTAPLEMESSEWWIKRLQDKLDARAPRLRVYDAYYRGEHRLRYATKKYREAFGGLFDQFSDNFCALVCDAVEERLHVEGFRLGGDRDATADKDAWRIWQANQLDAESQLAHTEALVKQAAYVHVSPFVDDWVDGNTPSIVIEDPLECIVESEIHNRRRRRAALKRWFDPDDGYVYLNLYLPDRVEKYRTAEQRKEAGTPDMQRWVRRIVVDEDWPLEYPDGFETVPIVPLVNRARVSDRDGRSEIAGVLPIQDAINKLCADMFVASEYAAYRQRYAINLETEVDENGQPKAPFQNGIDRLWTVPPDPDGNAPEVQFGEFSVADLTQYTGPIEMLIQHIASTTRTPAHYLLGQAGTFPSGESLKAVETGLVAKAQEKMAHFGESWEEVIRLAFLALNDARSTILDSETIWRDPESRTEAEHVDALVKLSTIGVPQEQLWEDRGYTPQQIERFKVMREEEARLAGMRVAPAVAPPTPPGEMPVPPAPAGT